MWRARGGLHDYPRVTAPNVLFRSRGSARTRARDRATSERAAKANLPYAMNLMGLLSSGPRSCAGPGMPFSPKSFSCSGFFRFSPLFGDGRTRLEPVFV